jgi:hypothetical protein
LPLYYGERLGLPLTEWLPDLAGYARVEPTPPGDAASAQVVTENGKKVWLAEPGSPVKLAQSGPLAELPFGHYLLRWPLRAEPELPPATELVRLSVKISGGGQVFNKTITAADLPVAGGYNELRLAFRNPSVDRWRTPLVFSAVSSGQARIWAGTVLFAPDPFYALLLPYLCLALLLAVALVSWYRSPDKDGAVVSSADFWAETFIEKGLSPASKPRVVGKYWGLVFILPLAAFGYAVHQQQQSSRTYAAGELSHFVGQAVTDPQAAHGRAWLVDPQVDPPQKAIYGPFDIYEAGRYQVTFRLKLPQTAESDQEVARLQVTAANGDQLITQPLRLEHFSKPNLYHDFVLTVANPRRQALSFEVYYHGIAPLLIDQVTISKVVE